MSKLLPIQPKNQSVEVENSLATIIESTVVLKKSLFNFKKFFVDRMRTDKKEVRVEKRQTFLELQQKERDKKERTLEKNTKPKNAGSGVVGKAAAAGGSLLDKLLGAGIMLALGWLVKWLPSIIDKVTLFFKNLGNLLNSIKNVVVAMGDTMKGVVAVVLQTLENWRNFDFFDANGKIQEKMDELNSNWDKVGKEWDNTVRDFNKLKNDAMSSMETQEQRTAFGTYAGGDVSGITSDSAEEARIAAAIVTEAGSGTATTDVLQVAANRIATGKYSNYTDVFADAGQFAGVFNNPRGGTQGYRNIQSIADAAAWAGVSENVIKATIADMRNPQLRADSANFVKGALQFRAAPAHYREYGIVPGEMGADGRFYNSSWRGGTGDNQFFTTPGDMGAVNAAAPVSYDGMNSPTLTPAPGAGQTVVLAGGTNTYGAPELAAQEMTAAIKNLKSKGYNVVVVPPNEKDRQFKPAYESIRDAATQEGVEVIRAEYDTNDPLHLSSQAVTAIRAKYPNAIYMGDSNAARLAGDRGKVNVREEGAGTDTILEFAQKLQRAAQPAAAVRPQTNQQTGQVSPRETAAPRISGNNQLSSTSLVSAPAPSVAPVRQTMASRSGVTVAVVNVPQPIPARRKSQFAMSVGGGGEDVETTLNRIAKVLLAYT